MLCVLHICNLVLSCPFRVNWIRVFVSWNEVICLGIMTSVCVCVWLNYLTICDLKKSVHDAQIHYYCCWLFSFCCKWSKLFEKWSKRVKIIVSKCLSVIFFLVTNFRSQFQIDVHRVAAVNLPFCSIRFGIVAACSLHLLFAIASHKQKTKYQIYHALRNE